MLNQLLRFTLVSSALLWLRPRWRGLLALASAVLLVHLLHGEYLGYVELSGNSDFLVWSYLVKWVALILSVTAYVVLAVYGLKPGGKSVPVRQGGTAALKRESTDPSGTLPAAAAEPADDGFDFLRNKKKLENRADKVIAAKRP